MNNSLAALMIGSALLGGLASARAGQVIYVNPNATEHVVANGASLNDGHNWEYARRDLAPVLAAANAAAGPQNPVEIWVAAGTFVPRGIGRSSSQAVPGLFDRRSQSFDIGSYVTLRGGFAGSETAPDQRSPGGQETILSGWLARDTLGDQSVLDVRAFNVVMVTNAIAVTLDRLTITGGAAMNQTNTAAGASSLAPVYSEGDLLAMETLDNDKVDQGDLRGDPIKALEREVAGGGLFVTNAYGVADSQVSLTMTDCLISSNQARAYGGGLAGWRANIVASRCRFTQNAAFKTGGGYWGLGQRIRFLNCEFEGNTAAVSGGGAQFDAFATEQTIAAPPEQKPIVAKLAGDAMPFVVLAASIASKTAGNAGSQAAQPLADAVYHAVTSDSIYGVSLGEAGAEIGSGAASALGAFGTAYNVAGLAVAAISLVTDIAVLCGGDPNNPFVKGWGKVSDGFSTYATPLGWLKLAFGIDLVGDLVQSFTGPPPTQRDLQFQYMTGQLVNYNGGPYSLVQECTFRNNRAGAGGGASVIYDNIRFQSCWFLTNSSTMSGGGLFCSLWTTPKIFDSVFSGNLSTNGHSAIYSTLHARSQIQSCTLIANRSGSEKGYAIGGEQGSAINLYNSALWNNVNPLHPGGGADLYVATSQTLAGPERENYESAGPTKGDFVATCDLRSTTVQSFGALPVGSEDFYFDREDIEYTGLQNTDENFGALETHGYVNLGEGIRPISLRSASWGNWRGNSGWDPHLTGRAGAIPLPTSSLLNRGSDYVRLRGNQDPSPSLDALGVAYLAVRERGAVQYQGANQQGLAGMMFHVRPGGTGRRDGTSWADAFDLGYLTNAFFKSAELWVAAGTYHISNIQLPSGIAIYGGFSGTETNRSQRDWISHPVMINGDGRQLFYPSGDVLVDGLCFTNASSGGGSAFFAGAKDATLSATRCAFRNCTGTAAGAIWWSGVNSVVALDGCTFVDCAATGSGSSGGAVAGLGTVGATNCWFEGCSAGGFGGALWANSDVLALNCVFLNDHANQGAYIYPVGAAMISWQGAARAYQCTFYGCSGSATVVSGDNFSSPPPSLVNCLFWKNTGGAVGADKYNGHLSSPQDFGDFDNDPRFVDEFARDFRLSSDSRAIDAGAGGTNTVLSTTDLAGLPRVVRQVDLGAYEFQGAPTPALPYAVRSSATFDQRGGILGALMRFDATPPTGTSATSLQWQVNPGTGWSNLSDGDLYQGSQSLHLSIWNPGLAMNHFFYRLVIDTRNYTRPAELLVYPRVLYVDGRRLGTTQYDGASWTTAYPFFYDAVRAARPGQQIWVAQGTYYPLLTAWSNLTPTPPESLALPNGVRILGGFTGVETDATQRARDPRLTVLDATTKHFTNVSSPFSFAPPGTTIFLNGSHCDRSAELDGFTITGALTTAVVNQGGSPTFTHCIFTGNSGLKGSVAANYAGANPLFSNCVFSNNTARAGTIYSENARGDWVNCLFFNNVALTDGGAFASTTSTLRLLHTTVTGNAALRSGGGIFQTNSTAILLNSILWQNRDEDSTGSVATAQMHADGQSDVNATNACVQGSAASAFTYDPLFVNPLADDLRLSTYSPLLNVGRADFASGLATDLDGNPRTRNAQVDLGCYQHTDSALPSPLYLISLPQPSSITATGIVEIQVLSTLSLASASAGWQWWVDTGAGFGPVDFGQGLYSLATNGSQLSLRVSVTNGSDAHSLAGNRYRVVLPGIGFTSAPLAAVSVALPNVAYVDRAATGPVHDGTSWATAFPRLMDALDTSRLVSEIWVAQGDYPMPASDWGRGYPLREGVRIYGGFVGTESNLSQRLWSQHITRLLPGTGRVIDGDVAHTGPLTRATLLDGFTLGSGTGEHPTVWLQFTSPTLQNCVFESGGVVVYGGGNPLFNTCTVLNAFQGIYVGTGARAELNRCALHQNETAVFCYDGTVSISDSVFQGNNTAIRNNRGSVTASRSTFRGTVRSQSSSGNAIENLQALDLHNCLFYDNEGAGVLNFGSLRATGCTFTRNHGTAIYNMVGYGASRCELRNSIFWDNVARLGGEFSQISTPYDDAPGTLRNAFQSGGFNMAASSCCIQGASFYSGYGVTRYDPLFVHAAASDFRLSADSPAVDAGDSSYLTTEEFDLAGQPRLRGARVDLGAYELQIPRLSPAALVQAPQAATGNALASATFSVELQPGGNPTNLVWQENRGAGWMMLSNSGISSIAVTIATTTLTLFPLALSMNGYQYRVANPETTFASPSAVLTVNSQVQVFVNAGATGATNGLTWDSAYRSVGDALDGATKGQQIWVRTGIYALTNALELRSGLALLGGFNGSELILSQRNPSANPTVLKAGAGLPVFHNATLHTDASAVLDGFTITGGNGVAAFINDHASPSIQNCLFLANSNGAVLNLNARATFSNCVFSNNVTSASGGAMMNSGAAPVLVNCVFAGNRAAGFGGALFSLNGLAPAGAGPHTVLSSCTFTGNRSDAAGGAVAVQRTSHDYDPAVAGGTEIEVVQCSFIDNAATGPGGAIHSFGIADGYAGVRLVVNSSTFTNNAAAGGGALQASRGDTWAVRNCLFVRNTSSNIGGAMACLTGSTTLYNCTFVGNRASGKGAGLFQTAAAVDIRNCIFRENVSALADPSTELQQLYLDNPSDPSGFPFAARLPAYVTVRNCDIQAADLWARAGTKVVRADPSFVNPGEGDYRLLPGSYLINAGDSSVAAGTDLAGNPRVFGDAVDLGPYESQTNFVAPIHVTVPPSSQSVCEGTMAAFAVAADHIEDAVWQEDRGAGFADIPLGGDYSVSVNATSSVLTIRPVTLAMNHWRYRIRVDQTVFSSAAVTLTVLPSRVGFVHAAATGTGDGSSWTHAFTNLSQALAAGDCYSELWVAQGTYRPPSGDSFRMRAFLGIYGGFAGTESARSQRDVAQHPTVLAGASNSLATIFNDGSGQRLDGTAILDGFQVTGWTGTAAIYNLDASPTLANCIILSTTFTGIINSRNLTGSAPIISNCVFAANQGVAVRNFDSAPTLIGCLFSNNTASATSRGSAIASQDSQLTVIRCVFVQNIGGLGGAMYHSGSNGVTTLTACIFQGNQGSEGGALFDDAGVSTTLRNCLLSHNTAATRGGAIAHHGRGLNLVNCTLADNQAQHRATRRRPLELRPSDPPERHDRVEHRLPRGQRLLQSRRNGRRDERHHLGQFPRRPQPA